MSPAAGFGATVALVLAGVAAGQAARRPARIPSAAPAADGSPGPAPAWVSELLAASGTAIDPGAAWVAARSAAGILVAAVAVGAGPVAAVLVVAAGGGGLLTARRAVDRHRDRRRDAQLAPNLERLAAALRAGRSPTQAVVAAAREAEEPLRSELAAVADRARHGGGLADALAEWSRSPSSSADVTLAATALELGATTGGALARSIDRVAATVRERQELRSEVKALSTQATASATLLTAAPVAFTLLVATIEPAIATFLLRDPIGLACLAGGLGLDALGALWMRRVMAAAS